MDREIEAESYSNPRLSNIHIQPLQMPSHVICNVLRFAIKHLINDIVSNLIVCVDNGVNREEYEKVG